MTHRAFVAELFLCKCLLYFANLHRVIIAYSLPVASKEAQEWNSSQNGELKGSASLAQKIVESPAKYGVAGEKMVDRHSCL